MLFVFTIIYLLSCYFHIKNNYFLSFILLSLYIVYFLYNKIKSKNLFSLFSLFTIGFIGGFCISLLKLSNLSTQYSIKTFIVIYIAYFSFYIGDYFVKNKKDNFNDIFLYEQSIINFLIFFVISISLIGFVIEVIKLKYIPIFSFGIPHAYSEFHIFMVHYLTTSFVFLPVLSSIGLFKFLFIDKNMISKKSLIFSLLGFLYSIFMSIILVSRFQLIFSLSQIVFCFLIFYIKNNKKLRFDSFKKYILICIVIFLIFYIVITIFRSHSIGYLNNVFDMKNKNLPIFITQPYIYITQNFENLNYMINNLPFFSYGRRTFGPIFALTMVKKFFPHVAVAAPLIIKDELTTNTLIYDFYYDFSFFGVAIFMFLIGFLMKKLENKCFSKKNNLLSLILYCHMSFYMMFSFFQSFFGLSQTFVYIILAIIIYFIYEILFHKYKTI